MEEVDENSAATSILNKLSEIESIADDLLVDRAQLLELEKKRQDNRSADHRLKIIRTKQEKTWMCFGNTFVKLPTTTVQSFLENNEKAIDVEINRLRDGVKEKVNKLQEYEGKAPLNGGYFLTPLSSEDATDVLLPTDSQ